MLTQRYKITLIVDLDKVAFPHKWIPPAIKNKLHDYENLVDFDIEKVSDDFELKIKIND